MDPVSEMKLQIFSNQYYDFVDSFANRILKVVRFLENIIQKYQLQKI